jgi:hypothetical protein
MAMSERATRRDLRPYALEWKMNPKAADSASQSAQVPMCPFLRTVNGSVMHACPHPFIGMRLSVAPHLAPLRASESPKSGGETHPPNRSESSGSTGYNSRYNGP